MMSACNFNFRRWIFGRLCYFMTIYFLILCVALPILTFRLRFSAYYQDPNANAQTQLEKLSNNARVEKASTQIEKDRTAETATSYTDLLNLRGTTFNVLITVVSMRRNTIDGYDPRYLSQIMTEMVNLLKRFQRDTGDMTFFSLALCNIDPFPDSYDELKNISEVYKIPMFTRFLESMPSESENRSRHLKEKNDYIYCLRKSLDLKSRYVMLMEDDALPISDALWVIRNTITNALQRFYKRHDESKLGFVKFYHPYRFVAFIDIWELIGFSAFFGTILTALHNWIAKDKSYQHLNWLVYILLAFLIGLLLGHTNLLKMRHLSPHLYTIRPAGTCCVPSVMFSNLAGHVFADYYDNYPYCPPQCVKDLLLWPFLNATKKKGLMVLPNIFDHIGLYSIVKKKVKHPAVLNKK